MQAYGASMVVRRADAQCLGGVGTGILLVATDTVSRGVMIAIGVWALASGAPHRGGRTRSPARQRPPRTHRPRSPTDKGTAVNGTTALVAVFVAYGLIASRLDRWLITAPIFFVATGLVLGPSGVGVCRASGETTLLIWSSRSACCSSRMPRPFGSARWRRCAHPSGCSSLACRSRRSPDRGSEAALPGGRMGRGRADRVDHSYRRRPRAGRRDEPCRAGQDAATGTSRRLNDGIATPFVTLFLTLVMRRRVSGPGTGQPKRRSASRSWPRLRIGVLGEP